MVYWRKVNYFQVQSFPLPCVVNLMKSNMIYSIISTIIRVFWLVFFSASLSFAQSELPVPAHQVGKEPLARVTSAEHRYNLPGVNLAQQHCVDHCLHQNQQTAMSYEAIVESCHQECAFKEALVLTRSSQKAERIAGIKALCASQDQRAVQPLITALQRDIKERTGMWAWIIPALGKFHDSSAVPILITTLTLTDEDWLGREMSARALGDLGDPSALPVLLAAAWRADTRGAAIEALANFQDRRVVPVMISALDPDEEPQTQEVAMSALHHLGAIAVPEMTEAFVDYSAEYPQTRKRLLLCQLLGSSGDEHALIILRSKTTDPDEAIASCAQRYGQIHQE